MKKNLLVALSGGPTAAINATLAGVIKQAIKDELAKQISKSRHCRIAELAAIMGFDGRIEQKNGKTVLEITTENAPLARKCFTLIKKTFNISTDIDVRTGNGMGHNHIYVISTDKPD